MLETGLLFSLVSVPIPSPVPAHHASPSQMVSWNHGEVRCDGMAVDGGGIRRPAVDVAMLDPQRVRPLTYRFAIDEAGRTHSIARAPSEFMPFGQDIGPALAASRFAPGAPRRNCETSYAPKLDSLAGAALTDLVAYSIFPTGQRLPKEGWDRFGTPGNCRDNPRPSTLLRAYPDFSKVDSTAGSRDWSLVAYDTDADGRPVNVRTAHTTGNAGLDAAAIEAVGASRFTGGPRTGCLYPYWRAAGKLAAPEQPAEEGLRPADAVCPAKIEWVMRPKTNYPPAYRKRAIEGWAIVSFDTAPWGDVGNVRVLDAQPSADFGQQATLIVRSGRVAPSAQGATGCVETVKFAMPDADYAATEDDPPVTD